MSVTKKQIEEVKKRYEEHFNIPFPKHVLFQIGNPVNIENSQAIFEDDLAAVEAAIRNDEPFDDEILKNIIF